jgi:exonuclease III
MIGAFWNTRGLNKAGKIKCLADFINSNKLDFVGIQETKKASFVPTELLAIHSKMARHYIPTVGSAGGGGS